MGKTSIGHADSVCLAFDFLPLSLKLLLVGFSPHSIFDAVYKAVGWMGV
jgi:hypothetical protein